MKCNKPYTVTSNNPKMAGSAAPMKSYMNGGMVEGYRETKAGEMREHRMERSTRGGYKKVAGRKL